MGDVIAAAQSAAYARGLKPDEFWGLTPYELNQWLAPHVERETAGTRLKFQLAAYQAWRAAQFSRAKRMPSLRKVMGEFETKTKTKSKSVSDLLSIAEGLNEFYGGKDLRAKA